MTQKPVIFIISGATGAGKTSVARALAQQFEKSVHIPVDELRDMVVTGMAHPIPVRTAEAERQLLLARQVAAYMAELYAEQDFVVIVDDVLFPEEAAQYFAAASQRFSMCKIFLIPVWEVVLTQNIERGQGRFDVAKWHDPLHALYTQLRQSPFAENGWMILDTSSSTVAETVQTISESANLNKFQMPS